jgi:signal transduction histidine kinase
MGAIREAWGMGLIRSKEEEQSGDRSHANGRWAHSARPRAPGQHSLRRKLFLSYAFLVLGVLGGGGWSIYEFTILGQSVRLIMKNNYRSVVDAQNMKETLERQDSAMQFHIAGYDRKALPQYEFNRQKFAGFYADAADNITEIGEPEAIHDIGAQFAAYSRMDQSFLRDRRLSTAQQARVYFDVLEPAFIRLKNRCQDLLDINQQAMVRAQHRAERGAGAATRTAIGLALVALVLGMLYAVNLSRALVAPLRRLALGAKRVGEGDLDMEIPVSTDDEVGALAAEFNRMAASLRAYREREAARLQVAEQKSDAVIDSLYEPVIVSGAMGEVIGLNPAAEPLFGPETKWIDQPAERLGVPRLSEAIREAIEKRTAVAPEGERGLAAITVDRSERCYRLRTAPLLRPARPGAADGDVAGTVTVLEDVTRLRQLDRLKDDFISVASHELRTPLTSLQMAVQLLAEGSAGALSPPQERLLRMAAADAERLDRLTRDLLDLTRLEAGTAVPNRRPILPIDVVDSALGPLRPQAEEKGIHLEVDVPAALPLISGDLEQLSRVVSNLVVNALRHTPSEGQIEISAAPAGDAVQFSVADTGPGIPPEYLQQVFERFVQVPGTSAGGAGLGLPIARKIVEAHGGTIGVDSTPGQGARFYFTVPKERK